MKTNKRETTESDMSPVVFCDFDGTITQVDVTDQILTQLAHPSWREIEQEWMLGLIGSRECLERQIALVDAPVEELHSVIDGVAIDDEFSAFCRFARRRRIPLYILSDGFDEVIRRVLAITSSSLWRLTGYGSLSKTAMPHWTKFAISVRRELGRPVRSSPPSLRGKAGLSAKMQGEH